MRSFSQSWLGRTGGVRAATIASPGATFRWQEHIPIAAATEQRIASALSSRSGIARIDSPGATSLAACDGLNLMQGSGDERLQQRGAHLASAEGLRAVAMARSERRVSGRDPSTQRRLHEPIDRVECAKFRDAADGAILHRAIQRP
jgi:hypothetical protein